MRDPATHNFRRMSQISRACIQAGYHDERVIIKIKKQRTILFALLLLILLLITCNVCTTIVLSIIFNIRSIIFSYILI